MLMMDSTEMDKLPSGNHENLRENSNLMEGDPCLPQGNRKSMEFLNKSRENEDQNNTYNIDSEKVNKNDSQSNFKEHNKSKKSSRLASIKFNPPPSKFEQWCMEKTGLSRFGLIAQGLLIVLLLLFILIVIIMSSLWPTLPHSLIFPLCRTSACLLASSEVLTKMNQSIDPCEDIRDYSCGHWFTTHNIPSDKAEWGLKQYMQHKHREKIRNLINTLPHPHNTDRLEWKVKTFYESCMSLDTIGTEDKTPLLKLINKLGGWNVLRSFSIQQFDKKILMRILHSTYNVQPFFKVEVVPDAKYPEQSIIQISPGSLGLPDRSYYYRRQDDKAIVAYKNFLKDVVMTLGARSDDATLFSEDMFGFEKRIAERFPARLPDKPEQYRSTIAKLIDIAPLVPFLEILTAMFPNAKLSKQSEVLVVASDHLMNISVILSTTDRSVLNNYLMWRLALDYLPYLAPKYTNTLHEFHKHLYGQTGHSPRWEFCVETVQKFIGYGVEAMLENAHPDSERRCKVAKELFQGIKTSARNGVRDSNNLPQHMKDHFLDKIDNINIQVGLPDDSLLSPSNYNNFYQQFGTIKEDFFQNVFYGVQFLLEEQQKRLHQRSEEYRWMDFVSDGKLNVVYIPELNKIIVPLGLLVMPYFNAHFPESVLYGSLGMEIGLAVIASVTGKGMLHAGDGSLLPSDHPVMNVTHDCFLHHPLETPYLEAIKYTYQALQTSLETLPHVHQPAMEHLEDSSIFFISYAQSLCTMKTPEKKDMDMSVKSHLSDDLSILEMVMLKSKKFIKTFSCKYALQKSTCDYLI